MKLRAVVVILRKNQVFHTRDAIIYRSWGFRGFTVDQVPAYYRKNRPVSGYAVALVLEPSPADSDFGAPILFPTEYQVRCIKEAMEESDELTHRLLGRGWDRGARPYLRVEDFV